MTKQIPFVQRSACLSIRGGTPRQSPLATTVGQACLARTTGSTLWCWWRMSERKAVLVHYRTEEAKQFRREHGDRGGCRYGDKLHRMNPQPWSNTVSTVTKDNL